MTSAMKAMFEPENLNNASPATVSRAGIIYVSETELGWEPLVKSWLQARKTHEKASLEPCFSKYVKVMLNYVRLNLKPVLHNEQVCQVNTLLTLLNGVLKKYTETNEVLSEDKYEKMFIYCLTWSIGGLLEPEDRILFNLELKKIAHRNIMPQDMDENDTIYEYFVDEEKLDWNHWKNYVPIWHYPKNEENPKFNNLIIPTLDSVRYEKLLNLVHSVNKATLLVGSPGTAKTSTINQFIMKFNPENYCSKTITFSCLTTPQIFQMSVEGAVEKRQGRTFGPPGGKSMIVFIDDISMPFINEWGDQVNF